jgi:hypothetical protein
MLYQIQNAECDGKIMCNDLKGWDREVLPVALYCPGIRLKVLSGEYLDRDLKPAPPEYKEEC